MLIYIGGDHRGFKLKEAIKAYLKNSGYEVADLGAEKYDANDDYPDIARLVAEQIRLDPEKRRGVLVCGSGVGIDIAANKFAGIRSFLALSPDHAIAAKNDDDTNIICLSADFTEEADAKRMVSVWLQTQFSGEERHKRRLKKIADIEAQNNMKRD